MARIVTSSGPGAIFGWPLGLILFARVILSGLGLILFVLGRVPLTEDAVTRPYFGIPPVNEGMAGAILGVWQRFDALHYLRIATHGYSSPELSVYFPLFPILTRATGTLLARNYLLASLVVSNVAAVLAVVFFYRLIIDEFNDQSLARRATAYLVFFPTGFFLLAPYTESLALFVSIVAIYEARRRRWLVAGIAGLACALTRTQGALIALLLAAEAIRQYRQGVRPTVSTAAALTLPVLGLATFVAWRQLSGFPPLTSVVMIYWQRVTAMPYSIIWLTFQRIAQNTASLIEYVDLAVVVLMVILGILMVKRLPFPYTIYYWTALMFNLTQLRVPQPISSQARYALLFFPAFIVLGQLGASPWYHRLILYSEFCLWVFLAGQFIMWGWVG